MKKVSTDPETILAALRQARGPMSPAELAERLEVEEHRAGFDAALAELEHAGRIVRNRAGLLTAPMSLWRIRRAMTRKAFQLMRPLAATKVTSCE